MKQYTFVLNFGYVESTRLSYLPFSSTNKYRDAKEALIDLAKFLKEQYLLQYEPKPKKCCIASSTKDSSSEFCSKCGKSLVLKEFDEDHFIQWMADINCADLDSFHGDFIEYSTEHRWQSDGLEDALNPRFVYQAEWVLAAAAGYPHKEDKTFEHICQDRTKNKRESFTYY